MTLFNNQMDCSISIYELAFKTRKHLNKQFIGTYDAFIESVGTFEKRSSKQLEAALQLLVTDQLLRPPSPGLQPASYF